MELRSLLTLTVVSQDLFMRGLSEHLAMLTARAIRNWVLAIKCFQFIA